MSETTIRVLLIEDNLGDARLIRKALADAIQADPDIPNFDIVRAAKLSTGLKRLAKGDVDVVLLDLSLPDSQGLETFTTAHASAPEIPIIVLSELEDKSLAVEAVRGGAQDYLVKGEADGSLLARAMRHAVEYKQMETTLRDSQAELAAIFENAPLMMLIVDHERRVQRVNGAAIHFADRPAEEMIGRRGGEALRCLHALDDPRGCGFGPSCETCVVRRTVMDTIEGDVRHTNVQAGLTIAGEEGAKDLALLVSTVPLAIAGKPRVLVCIEDVAERKWAEDETRILAEMVDASPASITVHDYDGNFVYANQKTLDLHGYTRDEFLALNLHRLDVPEGARLIAPRMQELRERGEASWEVSHYRKDGTTIPLRVHAKAARWGGQEVILSIATDITERKRADAALRESEQKYRFITEKMTDTVWLIDMEFKPTFISPSATHTLGYTLEELQVLPLDKLLTPESFEFAMKTVAAELSPERLAPRPYERSVTVELEFRRKDGFPLWSESTITMLRDSEGHPTGFMGVGRDITERKRAEEALRFTQFAVDRAADPVFWMGSDARLTYVNDTACRRLGYSREELLTKTVHDIDPNFPQEIWENHWREVKTRGSFTLESLHRTKDGQVFPVEIAVNFLEFEGKEYNCAFARDIAERKQAEQEREHLLAQVQEQARRVQQIIDTVPEGVILLDTKSRVVLANPLGRKDLIV